MQISLATVVLLTLFAFTLRAQAPWQGTWTLNERESHYITESLTVERGADGSLTVRNEGRSPMHFLPDGLPHTAPESGLTTFAYLNGPRSFTLRLTHRDEPVLNIEAKLSSDGKMLTEQVNEWHDHNTTYIKETAYTRVSGGDGFAGTWQARDPFLGDAPRGFQVRVETNGSFLANLPGFGRSLQVEPGGKEGSIVGIKSATPMRVAFQPDSARSFHWTLNYMKKRVVEGTAVLSSDGRSLRFEGWPPGRPSARSVAVYARQQ